MALGSIEQVRMAELVTSSTFVVSAKKEVIKRWVRCTVCIEQPLGAEELFTISLLDFQNNGYIDGSFYLSCLSQIMDAQYISSQESLVVSPLFWRFCSDQSLAPRSQSQLEGYHMMGHRNLGPHAMLLSR